MIVRLKALGAALLAGAGLAACLSTEPSGTQSPPATRPATERVYFASSLDAAETEELRELAPGVTIVSGLGREELLERAQEAHGMDAHLLTEEVLERSTDLVWVQAWSAGVERYLALDGLRENDGIVFTNMAGVHGPAIAEHALAMLLSLTRSLDDFRDAQRRGEWDRSVGTERMTALYGRTILVVGLGGIGTAIAERAAGFDMRVIATARTRREPPPFVEYVGGSDELDELLPEADVVAIAVPLTPETEGLFGRERFRRMKPGAWLINIARGRVVDTDALLEALETGQLSGACLDVTDPEPLPADHPLWQRDDVVITPHVAGRAEVTGERRWALFRENIGRFGRGQPLVNVVDKRFGY